MIKDIYMEVKVNHANRKKYEERLNLTLKNGQIIKIKQTELLETSRIEVECICDYCNNTCRRKRVNITGEKTFCDKVCRNMYLKESFKGVSNPNPKKDKVKVNCNICNEEIEVFESKYKKQETFLCSRECYKKHRSVNYSGENLYNFQDMIVPCEMCGEEVKTSQWYVENRNHIFCKPECYWNHRRTYYKEFYYKDDLNDARAETKPESMVRKWLEQNDIKFKQECGFLKKYYADFYLPDYKMIIEVYGDYWHVNPNIYDVNGNDKSKKPLNKNQLEHVESRYDEIRKSDLESYGYTVNILWEQDILNDLNTHISKFINVNIKK